VFIQGEEAVTRICYVKKRFSTKSQKMIAVANAIIAEYQAGGYALTLRQLYYQFVARDVIPNSQKEYKNLGSIINDARLAGLIDWEAIEDRTRNLRSEPHWRNPAGVIKSAADGYGIDLWSDQPNRVEVWVEKDALVGVLERPCSELDVAYFSCRGYTSQSELWGAAQRHMAYERKDQEVFVIHLGDHDPSGIDMSRDIQDRLGLFGAGTIVRRIALNMDQVEEHEPPPNPAKMTDARFAGYSAKYGDESWELDALEPKVLDALIRENIEELMDRELWDARWHQQEEDRKLLTAASEGWDGIAATLEVE
jgi:hypothetical protein